MKIQLSPIRIVEGAMTVWYEAGPDVDVIMDLKKLTFAENSIDAIYTFHVLEHLYPQEVMNTAINWYSLVKPGGELFVVVDDYEFITRSFVGGDLNVNMVNEQFSHPTHFTRDSLTELLVMIGFRVEAISIWFKPDNSKEFKYDRQPFELILSGKK